MLFTAPSTFRSAGEKPMPRAMARTSPTQTSSPIPVTPVPRRPRMVRSGSPAALPPAGRASSPAAGREPRRAGTARRGRVTRTATGDDSSSPRGDNPVGGSEDLAHPVRDENTTPAPSAASRRTDVKSRSLSVSCSAAVGLSSSRTCAVSPHRSHPLDRCGDVERGSRTV
jgi:hypothetical protein